MTKIAIVGSIHIDGWSVLKKNGCDVFEIKDGVIHINGEENILPYRAKPLLNYKIYSRSGVSSSRLISLGIDRFIRKYEIDISNQSSSSLNRLLPYLMSYSQTEDDKLIIITDNKGVPIDLVRSLNLNIIELLEKEKDVKLTSNDIKRLKLEEGFDSINRITQNTKTFNTTYFPNNIKFNWNNDNFGPITIPKEGQSLNINLDNLPIYKRVIGIGGNFLLDKGYKKNTFSSRFSSGCAA